jgi:hypothetical protein
MLRIAHCIDNRLIDDGKVVSLTHPPHFNNNNNNNNDKIIKIKSYEIKIIQIIKAIKQK